MDTLKQYIADHIIEDPKESLSLRDLYMDYKCWHKENYPTCPLARKDVSEYLTVKYGTNETNNFKTISLKY